MTNINKISENTRGGLAQCHSATLKRRAWIPNSILEYFTLCPRTLSGAIITVIIHLTVTASSNEWIE